MKTVVLRLIGPLQAWGAQSRFGNRDTQLEPTKSGVLGIVAAALGMPRTDDGMLAQLVQCRMVVRVDCEGQRMRDYHVSGGGSFRGQEYGVWESDGFHGRTVLSDRFYVTNAAYHVALEYADDSLAETIATQLKQPVFPLFLGRRSCPPTVPIACGDAHAQSATQVLVTLPLHVYETTVSKDSINTESLIRYVVECEAHEGRACADVPLSFVSQSRQFGVRYIKNEWHIHKRLDLESPI